MSTLCIGISHILLHISTLFWIPDPMVGGGLEPLFPPSRSGNVFPTMSTHTCLHLFHAQANIPQQSHQLQLWQAFNFSPIGNSTPFIEYFTVRNSICTESCKFPNQPKPKSAFKAFYLHNINNSLGKWSFINWSLLKLQYFAAFLPAKYRLGQCLAIWDLPELSPGSNPPPRPRTSFCPPAMPHIHASNT